MLSWEGVLEGPPGSPYRHGMFLVSLTFPPDYDQHPPTVVFKTIPFHPNVDASTGKPCMDALDPSITWAPRVCLPALLVMLQQLLAHPVLDNPVNAEAAHAFVHDPDTYNKIARQCVDASRRVQAGLEPYEGFSPQPSDLDDVMRQTHVETIPQSDKGVSSRVAHIHFSSACSGCQEAVSEL